MHCVEYGMQSIYHSFTGWHKRIPLYYITVHGKNLFPVNFNYYAFLKQDEANLHYYGFLGNICARMWRTLHLFFIYKGTKMISDTLLYSNYRPSGLFRKCVFSYSAMF